MCERVLYMHDDDDDIFTMHKRKHISRTDVCELKDVCVVVPES